MLFSATSPENWLGVNEKSGGGAGGRRPEVASSWHNLPSRVQGDKIELTRAEEDGLFFQRQGYFCKASFEGD